MASALQVLRLMLENNHSLENMMDVRFQKRVVMNMDRRRTIVLMNVTLISADSVSLQFY